jgi:photosystem II stability/assembly factor-like uncharacterized protein
MAAVSSNRRLRGLALIALASVTIGVAGFTYLHPSMIGLPQKAATAPKPIRAPSPDPLLSASEVDSLFYDFVSPKEGWALDTRELPYGQPTNFWVFHTIDGGKRWQKQFAGRAALAGRIRLQFFDATHGLMFAGDPSTFYRTSDGGKQWLRVVVPNQQIDSLDFTDPQHGWLLQQTGGPQVRMFNLFSTTDGGAYWTLLPPPPADAFSLAARNPGELWLGTGSIDQPHVYLSLDSGRTWERRTIPMPPQGDPALTPFCTGTGLELLPAEGVVASTGCKGFASVVTSFDLGVTWSYLPPPPPYPNTVGRVGYQDARHWWLMAGGDLYKTSDAGQTWAHVGLQLDEWEYFPHPLDAMHAWAQLVILGPLPPNTFHRLSGVAVTSDGGVHWTRVKVPHPT